MIRGVFSRSFLGSTAGSRLQKFVSCVRRTVWCSPVAFLSTSFSIELPRPLLLVQLKSTVIKRNFSGNWSSPPPPMALTILIISLDPFPPSGRWSTPWRSNTGPPPFRFCLRARLVESAGRILCLFFTFSMPSLHINSCVRLSPLVSLELRPGCIFPPRPLAGRLQEQSHWATADPHNPPAPSFFLPTVAWRSLPMSRASPLVFRDSAVPPGIRRSFFPQCPPPRLVPIPPFFVHPFFAASHGFPCNPPKTRMATFAPPFGRRLRTLIPIRNPPFVVLKNSPRSANLGHVWPAFLPSEPSR